MRDDSPCDTEKNMPDKDVSTGVPSDVEDLSREIETRLNLNSELPGHESTTDDRPINLRDDCREVSVLEEKPYPEYRSHVSSGKPGLQIGDAYSERLQCFVDGCDRREAY